MKLYWIYVSKCGLLITYGEYVMIYGDYVMIFGDNVMIYCDM